jgi:hypothetical protein
MTRFAQDDSRVQHVAIILAMSVGDDKVAMLPTRVEATA